MWAHRSIDRCTTCTLITCTEKTAGDSWQKSNFLVIKKRHSLPILGGRNITVVNLIPSSSIDSIFVVTPHILQTLQLYPTDTTTVGRLIQNGGWKPISNGLLALWWAAILWTLQDRHYPVRSHSSSRPLLVSRQQSFKTHCYCLIPVWTMCNRFYSFADSYDERELRKWLYNEMTDEELEVGTLNVGSTILHSTWICYLPDSSQHSRLQVR